MKIKNHEVTIIEHRPCEPWPKSISVDGQRMDYNDKWENTVRGQIIYYKSPEDKSIYQGIGFLRRDLLRIITNDRRTET